MMNYKLTEARIGSAQVIVDILPKGKVIPNTSIKPTSITIHNTGNIGASASNNHKYMANLNKNGGRTASWHFTVDDKFIYQAVPTNMKAWHAGTAAGNNSSIGIEICMFNDAERQKKCYLNAIALVKILMSYHGFTTSKVKRHKDWSGKDCPTWLISGKFGYTWNWFIQSCSGTSVPNVTTTKQNTSKSVPNGALNKKGKVTASSLNVRKGRPGSKEYNTILKSLPKGTVVTVSYVLDGWGSIYITGANPGFISLQYIEFI